MHLANEAGQSREQAFHKVQGASELQDRLSQPLSIARALCHKRRYSPDPNKKSRE
jgi:hypothetical protein